MRVPMLGNAIDERFLTHRLRATSAGGIAGGVLAAGLFAYYNYADHVWRWDLIAVAATMAVVKQAVLLWYRVTD